MKLFSVLRKGLASVTLAALALTMAPLQTLNAASVSSFTDANQIPSWADEAIEELMDQGVISGNGDGSFAPNRQLNRAEVSKIIVLATGVDMDTSGGNAFPDVTAGDWFYDYVMTMYNYGWVNGYPDGFFRPGVGINRVELAKMVVEAFELDTDTTGGPHFSDVSADSWMYPYVETAFNNGLMTGFASGRFGAELAVTRAETAKIVYDGQLVVAGPVGPAEGTLEVNLSFDTPRGTNIPFNATSVPFTTVEMTAADDSDVEISSITVTRLGLGDNDDFDNVWLEIDGFKVGNERAINNDDYAELRFNPPIVVPAGQTLVADVVGSLEGNADSVGQHNRIAVVSAADVVSTAVNVVGDFPIEGEEMEIADYQVSQIEFDGLGSDTTVNVGDAFVEIGKYKLLNATTTNKDVELRAITFKNDGTAQLADVLENVVLYVSGEQVSAETIIDGDYVTFRLDNGVTGGYIIEDGDSRIFSIRADIVTAEDGDVINFKVDNFEDIVGVEVGTAFGVKSVSGETNTTTFSDTKTTTGTASCTGDDAEDNCARLRAYVIDSGDINISRDPASLGNQEYAPGSNDVVFMTARIVVDQPLTADGINVRVATGTSVLGGTIGGTTYTADTVAAFQAQFDNFRLYLNDQLIDSKNELTESTSLVGSYFEFDTQFEIAGTSVLKLVGNIKDGALTGSQVKFSVNAANDIDSPEYISTGDQVEASQLLGSAESSFVEVQQSNLTITKTDGFSIGTFTSAGETFVAGADDLTVFKFVLDNNDAGDVNVTSLTVNAYGTGNAATYSNFQAAIFVDGVQQGSSRNFEGTTTGAATFNDLSVNIPSAGQKEFTLVLDTIESSANGTAVSTTLATGTGVESVVASAGNVYNTADATIAVGSTTITVPATTAVAALSAGDQIIVSTNGEATTPNAEIRTVASDVTAVAGGGGATTITVTEPFENGHAADMISTVTTQYAAASGSVTLANATGLKVGDVIRIAGATGGAVVATDFAVRAISGNVVTLGESNASTTADTLATAVALSAAVTQQNSDSEIQFKVSAIDVDNVENGQSVEVTNLSDADANCNANLTATSSLCSAVFGLVSTGTLNVNTKLVNPETRVMLAGQNEFTVFQMNLNANNDNIELAELFFINDLDGNGTVDAVDQTIAQRVDFKLYDEAGTLIQSKTMATTGELHFQLPDNQRIIVPENDSTYLTVKVDVRDITEASHTGARLRLALDTNGGTDFNTINGIEAFTSATGANIDTAANNPASGEIAGDIYVAYRTNVEFANAATQPTFTAQAANTTTGNAIYRFTVTADNAYNATLDKVTLNVSGSTNVFPTAIADATLMLYRYSSAAFTGNPTKVALRHEAQTATLHELAFVTGEEVSAGSTNYYELRTTVEVADTAAENDSISVAFVSDADYPAAGPNSTRGVVTADDNVTPTQGTAAAAASALEDGENNIVWSDRSNNGGFGPYLNGFELIVPQTSTGSKE